MPISKKRRQQRIIEAAQRERDDFCDRSNWEPSKSNPGNIWRLWAGVTVSVFLRSDGFFGWSVSDGDGPQYSPRGFESQEEAIAALAGVLDVGEIADVE